MMLFDETIAAIATPPGSGAIAVIRLSGKDAVTIADKVFSNQKGKKLSDQKANTIHFGKIIENNLVIDEVLVSVYKAPKSYTGEDSIEISCHGSTYIQQKILNVLIQTGARYARPGEYTQRAFLNGKLDLSQAEAVADLISSESATAHKVAMQQMKGGFTSDLKELRQKLLNFISLIELELDFSEEDVEFADRTQFKELIDTIEIKISDLLESFQLGNVLKKGVPTVIAGRPNAGKSTLLNLLLNENRAIVSEIEGTTRDSIEEVMVISGVMFRFIDTAGLRETIDEIEKAGVERTYEHLNKSSVFIYLFDINSMTLDDVKKDLENLPKTISRILLANKTDLADQEKISEFEESNLEFHFISAKYKEGHDLLKEELLKIIDAKRLNDSDTVISNVRHYDILQKAHKATIRVIEGLNSGISGDFLAQDIREILNQIGEITGEYTSDEVLGNIFKNFCIGK